MDARYDVTELKNACTLINTADYCQTTALELEENIRAKCDDAFKEQITLQEECDLFIRYGSSFASAISRENILTLCLLAQCLLRYS